MFSNHKYHRRSRPRTRLPGSVSWWMVDDNCWHVRINEFISREENLQWTSQNGIKNNMWTHQTVAMSRTSYRQEKVTTFHRTTSKNKSHLQSKVQAPQRQSAIRSQRSTVPCARELIGRESVWLQQTLGSTRSTAQIALAILFRSQ